MATTEILTSAHARHRRAEKLSAYLRDVCSDGLIVPFVLERSWEAWSRLAAAVEALPVPDACPGAEGQLLYSWKRAPHYLELEFSPDRPAEFFYRNDITGELWEAEWPHEATLPEAAVTRLSLFI